MRIDQERKVEAREDLRDKREMIDKTDLKEKKEMKDLKDKKVRDSTNPIRDQDTKVKDSIIMMMEDQDLISKVEINKEPALDLKAKKDMKTAIKEVPHSEKKIIPEDGK